MKHQLEMGSLYQWFRRSMTATMRLGSSGTSGYLTKDSDGYRTGIRLQERVGKGIQVTLFGLGAHRGNAEWW
jgi:hypothetical protein